MSHRKKIKIGLVDDHLVLLDGLKTMFELYDEIEVLFTAFHGKDLLNKLNPLNLPDIILMDIEMPVMDGIQACEILGVKYPQINVIILSMHPDDLFMRKCAKSGASAYLSKLTPFSQIMEAIKVVHKSGYFFNEKFCRSLIRETFKNEYLDENNLTEREVEVLKLICKEQTNLQMAEILHVSIRTIEKHRLNISKKIKTSNNIGLFKYAINSGHYKLNRNILEDDPGSSVLS